MDKNTVQSVYNEVKTGVQEIEQSDMQMFPQIKSIITKVPVFLIVPIGYVVLGMVTNLWHPLWLLFFLIPIHLWLCFAFNAKNMKSFLLRLPIPLFAVVQFLCSGLFLDAWKYAWLTFLLIPLYYCFVAAFMRK